MLVSGHSISWQKVLHVLRNSLKWENFFYAPSGITIKVRAVKQSSTMICYFLLLETLRQRVMLRIISRFSMFLKMVRRKRNFDIYYISRNYAFSSTRSVRVKILTTGQFRETFTLIKYQWISFTPKSSIRCILLATTHVFCARDLQFKKVLVWLKALDVFKNT